MIFSIIIPTYNGLNLLKKSIATWTNQVFPLSSFEILIIDNNSSEDIKGYIDNLDCPNMKYLFMGKKGATEARHLGARNSSGDFLIFADNDGLYNSECLAEILKVYHQNPEAEAVACKIDVQWDGEEPDWIGPYKFMLGQLDYGDEVSYSTEYWMNGGLMSIKKDTFERLGGFNPDLVGKYLIGDGDTGLVKKLHREKILIGWTPNAHMYHMQQVAKHGSINGIARHFYNNGIAESYALYREEDFHFTPKVIKYLIFHILLYTKKFIQYYFLQKKDKEHFFSFNSRKGELKFFINLLNPKLRKTIRQKNVYSAV